MDTYYKFNKNADILLYLEKNFPEFKGFTIPIIFSDEIPPILGDKGRFKDIEENEKLPDYPICELLGKYDYQTNHITIYLQGINKVTDDKSSYIGYSKSDLYQMLLKVVILHEIGHYWFHNSADDPNLKKDPDYESNKIDYLEKEPERCEYIDEWIAQMFAYLSLDTEKERVFMKELSKKQPDVYRSFTKNIWQGRLGDKCECQKEIDVDMIDVNRFNIDDFKLAVGLLKLKEVYCVMHDDFKHCIGIKIKEIIRMIVKKIKIKEINDVANLIKQCSKY